MNNSAKIMTTLTFLLLLIHSASAVAQDKHLQLLSQETGWFLGQGKLYWTIDNGAHWADITPRLSLPGEKIADIDFKNAQDGWVLLSTDENHGPEAVFEVASTTNSGGSWVITPVQVPETGSRRRPSLPGEGTIFFSDSMHGWLNLDLEGGQNFSPALLLSTEDGGNSWTQKLSPGRGGARFITAHTGWVAGGPGGQYLYSTKDGGMRWQEISLSSVAGSGRGALYSAPEFSDTKHGLLMVTLPSRGAMVLYATSDGGRSWKPSHIIRDSAIMRSNVPVPSSVADSVWLVAKGDYSSLTLIKNHLALRTSEPETRTTEVQKNGVPTSVLDISFTTHQQGWVLTNRLYSTRDGGQAWKDITPWAAPVMQTVPVPSSSVQP